MSDRTKFGSRLHYSPLWNFGNDYFTFLASWVIIHSQAEPSEFPSPIALTFSPIFFFAVVHRTMIHS